MALHPRTGETALSIDRADGTVTVDGDAAADREIHAPMPGLVLRVLVAPGDAVEAGQGVVVLEAMKMENEIQAQVAGVVKKIFVEEGQSVEGGDPLFEIESA